MKKIFLISLFALLLVVPFASAIGDVKVFDKNQPTKGKISIVDNWNLPFISTSKVDYLVTSWTDQCLMECSGDFLVNVHKTGKIFDNFKVKGRDNLDKLINIKITISDSEEYQSPVYAENCTMMDVPASENSTATTQEVCHQYLSGYETKTREIMKPYDYSPVDEGIYKVRIEGKKTAMQSIDIIPVSNGIDLNEWAWWNSNWIKKQQINLSENSGGDLVNYSVKLNVTWQTGMKADFSDIRFLNATETGELYYWNESQANSASAIFWVMVPSLQASVNKSIYIYFNNSGATSTENINNSFLIGDEFSGTALDSVKWGLQTTPTLAVAGGRLNITATSDSIWRGIYSNNHLSLETGKRIISVSKINDATDPINAQTGVAVGTDINSAVEKIGQFMSINLPPPKIYGFRNSTSFIVRDGFTANQDYRIEINYNLSYINITASNGTIYSAISQWSTGRTGSPFTLDITVQRNVPGKMLSLDYIAVANYVQAEPTSIFGAVESATTISTTLISPINYFNSSSNNITFSIDTNLSSGVTLSNITIYVWNSTGSLINSTFKTISGSYNRSLFNITFNGPDQNYTWNALSASIDALNSPQWATSNFTFKIDITAPVLTITLPVNNTIFTNGTNRNLNYTSVDASSPVDSCWYNINSGSNINLPTCANNYFNLSVLGINTLRVFSNDSVNNIVNKNLTLFLIQNNYTLSAPSSAIETSLQDFNSTYALGTGYQLNNASFFYNSTRYSQLVCYNSSGSAVSFASCLENFSLRHQLRLPLITPNLSSINYYWELNVTNAGVNSLVNSSTSSINVSKMVITVCGTLTNTTSLNFTNYYELNRSRLNGTNFLSTMFIWLPENYDNRTQYWQNYSFSILADADGNFPFCIYPAYADYQIDSYSDYEKGGFAKRTHIFQQASINNQSQTIDLYLVELTNSSTLIIKTVDPDLIPLSSIVVRMQRFYPELNSYIEVENGRTDDLGQTVLHIQEQTATYKFLFYNSNNSLITVSSPSQVVCYSTPCVVTYVMNSTQENLFDNYRQGGISYSLSYSETTNNVSFSFTDSNGLTTSTRLLVNKYNSSGSTTICDTNISGSSGSAVCPLTQNGTYFAQAYYTQNGANKILDRLTATVETTAVQVFGDESLFWAVFFIIELAMVGIWNPIVAVAMTLVGVVAIFALGIVSLSYVVVISAVILGVIVISQLKT